MLSNRSRAAASSASILRRAARSRALCQARSTAGPSRIKLFLST